MNDPRQFAPDAAAASPGELDPELSGSGISAELPHLALISIDGTDAAAFLQAQFTNDVTTLVPGHWQWDGYCGPKGRLVALLRLIRTTNGFLVETSADIAADLISRLRRFVLRAKVTIGAWSGSPIGLGIAGTGGARVLEIWRPGILPGPGSAHAFDGGLLIEAGSGRWHCHFAGDADADATRLRGMLYRHIRPAPPRVWASFDLDEGIPWIVAATQDLFIPQMVDLERLGGVSFSKGCYPGQEIVARSQYLGAVKRRLYRARAPVEIAPGTPLSSRHRPDQAVGHIVGSAPAGDGTVHVLAVVDNESAKAGSVHPAGDSPALEDLVPVHAAT